MTKSVSEIRASILSLPEEQIRELLESLQHPAGDEWPDELVTEWETRAERVEKGNAVLIPATEVFRKLREKRG
jgi:hypothetical protein